MQGAGFIEGPILWLPAIEWQFMVRMKSRKPVLSVGLGRPGSAAFKFCIRGVGLEAAHRTQFHTTHATGLTVINQLQVSLIRLIFELRRATMRLIFYQLKRPHSIQPI